MSEIGICLDRVGSVCNEFHLVDNFSFNTFSTFDWTLVSVIFFGLISLWLVGLKFGFFAKLIKRGGG